MLSRRLCAVAAVAISKNQKVATISDFDDSEFLLLTKICSREASSAGQTRRVSYTYDKICLWTLEVCLLCNDDWVSSFLCVAAFPLLPLASCHASPCCLSAAALIYSPAFLLLGILGLAFLNSKTTFTLILFASTKKKIKKSDSETKNKLLLFSFVCCLGAAHTLCLSLFSTTKSL